MVKMIAIFKRPQNVEAFLEHYENVHLPMIRQMPGLRKLEVNYFIDLRGGDADPFAMAEMYFDDQDSLMASMKSPEGKAGGKDLQTFASDLVQITFAEAKTEAF
jgi:uncharacterized protein (TIGR02118 family)